MEYRYCESGEKQTIDQVPIVLWIKITWDLKHAHKEDNKNIKNNDDEVDIETIDSENSPNKKGSGVLAVASKETCKGDCEGIAPHAVVARGGQCANFGSIGFLTFFKISIGFSTGSFTFLKISIGFFYI